MATTITNECINCGACEPECPNTAIYAGGVPWELDGATGPAIAQDIYFIVPSKCTECVGFFDHEACAAVCPVDCCIPDPANVESEGVLLARARKLHPDETFPDDPPSRFRKQAARRGSGGQRRWQSQRSRPRQRRRRPSSPRRLLRIRGGAGNGRTQASADGGAQARASGCETCGGASSGRAQARGGAGARAGGRRRARSGGGSRDDASAEGHRCVARTNWRETLSRRARS